MDPLSIESKSPSKSQCSLTLAFLESAVAAVSITAVGNAFAKAVAPFFVP